ncbi:kinase-like protein [Backusella circina FSU 941]|nr:kinase-like protein [Backusella circina FSU 941]
MNDCTSQQDHVFHQLTLNGALTDALMVLYNTNKSNNQFINKFLQLYKPICQKIDQIKVSINSFVPILDKPFAKGAFGKVTIVKSTANDSVYAMKIIKKSRLILQMGRATPMEERLILSHPKEEWLPKLHASFQDTKYLYLVMEYTPGGDLGFLIDRKQVLFTENVARFYIAELILAIERVHQLGYIHRDIKPGNILIDKAGHIKLGDLGSCISIDSEEPLSMVGTPFYMSPEMFNSLGSAKPNCPVYGKEVDWWSVGVVLYELLVVSNSINETNTERPLHTIDLKVFFFF